MEKTNKESLSGENSKLIKSLQDRIMQLEESNQRFQNDITMRKLSQEGLREGQQFLQGVLSSIGDTFFLIFDEKGMINFCWGSKKLEEKYGINLNEYMGKFPDEYFLDISIEEKTSLINFVFNTEELVKKEWIVSMPTGKFWLEFTFSQIKDEKKGINGVVAAVKNITDRKKLEQTVKENEENFRIISEQSLMGIMIHQDHHIIYVNKAAADIYEHSIEEILNWKKYELSDKYIHPNDRDFVDEQGRKKQSGEKGYITNYILRIIPNPGKVKWLEIYSKTIIYRRKTASLVTIIDITERKKTEEKLKESEEKFRIIADQSLIGIIINQSDRIVYVNDVISEITGISKNKLLSVPFSEFMNLVHPDDLTQIIKFISRREQGNKNPTQFELRFKKKSGEYIWVQQYSRPIPFQGEIAVQTVLIDIDDRKKVEERLKESEERYRLISKNARDVIWTRDKDLNLTYISPSVKNMLGYTDEEFYNLPIEKYIPPSSLKRITYVIFEEIEINKSKDQDSTLARILEVEHVHKNGDILNVEISVTSAQDSENKNISIIGITRGITERKRAEKLQKETENLYHNFIQNFHGIVYKGKINFHPIFFHGEVEKITGYTEQEFSFGNLRWDELIHPDDILDELSFKKIQTVPNYSIIREYRILHKSGEIRWILENIHNVCDNLGKPTFVQGMLFDITKNKQMEQKLKESEEKFRIISEQSLMGIMIVQNNFVKYTNKAAAEIYEHTIEEIMDWEQYSIPNKFVHPDDRDFVRKQGRKKQSGKEGYITNYTFRLIPHLGKVKWIEVYSKTIIYRGKPANLVTIIDVTERKEIRDKLKESEVKYRTVIEESNDGIVIIQDEIIQYINPAISKMLGYSYEEYVGKPYTNIVHPDEMSKVTELYKKRMAGEKVPKIYESLMIDKNGNKVEVEFNVGLIPFRGRIANLTTVRN
ncbi:MAG: PAS domain S-box protein, partial [Promethearchaeota archaeon]